MDREIKKIVLYNTKFIIFDIRFFRYGKNFFSIPEYSIVAYHTEWIVNYIWNHRQVGCKYGNSHHLSLTRKCFMPQLNFHYTFIFNSRRNKKLVLVLRPQECVTMGLCHN